MRSMRSSRVKKIIEAVSNTCSDTEDNLESPENEVVTHYTDLQNVQGIYGAAESAASHSSESQNVEPQKDIELERTEENEVVAHYCDLQNVQGIYGAAGSAASHSSDSQNVEPRKDIDFEGNEENEVETHYTDLQNVQGIYGAAGSAASHSSDSQNVEQRKDIELELPEENEVVAHYTDLQNVHGIYGAAGNVSSHSSDSQNVEPRKEIEFEGNEENEVETHYTDLQNVQGIYGAAGSAASHSSDSQNVEPRKEIEFEGNEENEVETHYTDLQNVQGIYGAAGSAASHSSDSQNVEPRKEIEFEGNEENEVETHYTDLQNVQGIYGAAGSAASHSSDSQNVEPRKYIEFDNSDQSYDDERTSYAVTIQETSSSTHISDSDEEHRALPQETRRHLAPAQNILDYTEDTGPPLTRKRKRNPNKWKRNLQKKLRMDGKEFQNRSGKKVRPREVKQINCKCHYNCNNQISLERRQELLAEYLKLGSDQLRWSFLAKCVTNIPVKRRYQSGNAIKRNNTLVYRLVCNGNETQVCKKFFLATFDISAQKVRNALSKQTPAGTTESDKRGHKEPPNKKSEDVKNIIRDHIKSLPVVSSHYFRSSTKRKYLPSGLSENRLYVDYVEYCKEKQLEPEKASYYKHIFTNEFNYGFHKPKKDQCDYCTQVKNMSPDEKELIQNEYDLHMQRKEEARQQKDQDKERARADPSFTCFTMDMEKVLVTPSLQIGQLYYKKKLKTYNFTIYELATSQATNYMWHEGEGGKGASETATCLWRLLSELKPEVKEVTFYSDTAAGQNRNSIVSSMFLRAVRDLPIEIINQKFMESGHSEMECDSVHSAIEMRGRQIDVFTPEGWYTVARTAKVNRPYYKVVELSHSDFLDFKSYSNQMMTNKNKIEDGDKMNWLHVKWFQYQKSGPETIYYKAQLSQENFQCLQTQRRRRIKNQVNVPKLYTKKLKIQKSKLKDLKELCQKGKIPSTYHAFYNNLDEVTDSDSASEVD